MNLKNCRAVSTSGEDKKEDEEDSDDRRTSLGEEQKSAYRGVTARMNYLSQGRPHIMLATKEACREMSDPNPESWKKIERITKYQKHFPIMVWKFGMQDPVNVFDIRIDANWAGCRRTRSTRSGTRRPPPSGGLLRSVMMLVLWRTPSLRVT